MRVREFAHTILDLQGEGLVLQLRDDIPHVTNPGQLQPWGGTMEERDGGDPVAGARRELRKETDLDVRGLNMQRVNTYEVDDWGRDGAPVHKKIHVFGAVIVHMGFRVFEGTSRACLIPYADIDNPGIPYSPLTQQMCQDYMELRG